MKRTKLLSLLLAIVMILTSFTAAFPVFATSNVEKAETLIANFKGIMKREKPTAKHLAAYNEMLDAYNALSQEEIDDFDVILFDKLLLAVYAREIVLWKAENNSTSTSNASKASHERAKAVIKMPAYVDEAIDLATSVNSVKKQNQADALLEKLKTVSPNAVIMAGAYYKLYNNFNYEISKKYGAAFIDTFAKKISAITQAADSENKPKEVKVISKPNPKKFEGGESNPAYIEEFKKYLESKEANAEYMVKEYAFEGEKHYMNAVKAITDAVPSYSYFYDIAVSSISAKRAFDESGDVTVNGEVKKIYSSLSDEQKTWLTAFGNTVLCNKKINSETAFGTEYGYSTWTINSLVNFCVDLDGFHYVNEFENIVASVDEPYTNSDIETVKMAFKKIPASFTGGISKEISDKYKKILAAIKPDDISEEQPDLSKYKATNVSYANISENNAKELADIVVDLALKAAGVSDAKELINTKVLTNETVLALAKLLYPLLADLTTDLISVNPKTLSNSLKEEEFAGAAAALAAADDWDAVIIKNGDFGFADGDAEGFLDAAAAMLRGGSLIHLALKLENSLSTSIGTYYGAYEDLVPILEMLDLKSVMSSDDYTAYVKAAENSNDAKFRAILAPIVYLLVDFGNDPINTICDVLPKVAYAIDSNTVNDGVNALLSKMTLVDVDPVDLTTAGVYKILNDKLLAPKEIKLSEESFAALISDLSGCGTAVAKSSVARGHAYRLGIESDKAKSMVVIMAWLIDSTSNNKEFVNSLLDMLITDNNILKSALKLLIGASATFVPKKLVYFLVMIFIHVANIYTSLSKVLDK